MPAQHSRLCSAPVNRTSTCLASPALSPNATLLARPERCSHVSRTSPGLTTTNYFDLKKSEGGVRSATAAAQVLVWVGLSGQGADLDQVVGEYPVPAPDGSPVPAVKEGPVPAVAALEIADPAFAPGPPFNQLAEAAAVLDDLTGR